MPIDEFIAILEKLQQENPDAIVLNIEGNPSLPEFDNDKDVIV